MKPRKLAIVRSSSTLLSLSNYNIQEIGLANALLEFNISSDIYLAGKEAKVVIEPLQNKDGKGVRLIYLPYKKLPGRQAIFPDLIKSIGNEKYDLIQVHEDSQITSCLIALYGAKKKIPVVLCQGMYQNYDRLIPKLFQFVYDKTVLNILRNNVACCIAKTRKAKYYLEKKGFTEISVCPVGLDIRKLISGDESNFRELHQISASMKIVLYVGVIEPRRNVDFIIRVFYELSKLRNDICLVIAGEGPDKSKCDELSKSLRINDKILFLGKVPQKQLKSIYKAADVFLLPSKYEIYGMALMEAMYFGIPVIASLTAGPEEIIESGVNGFIVPDLQIDKWKNHLQELLSDSSLANIFRYNARRRIEKVFLWKKTAPCFLNIYLKALSGKSAV